MFIFLFITMGNIVGTKKYIFSSLRFIEISFSIVFYFNTLEPKSGQILYDPSVLAGIYDGASSSIAPSYLLALSKYVNLYDIYRFERIF